MSKPLGFAGAVRNRPRARRAETRRLCRPTSRRAAPGHTPHFSHCCATPAARHPHQPLGRCRWALRAPPPAFLPPAPPALPAHHKCPPSASRWTGAAAHPSPASHRTGLLCPHRRPQPQHSPADEPRARASRPRRRATSTSPTETTSDAGPVWTGLLRASSVSRRWGGAQSPSCPPRRSRRPLLRARGGDESERTANLSRSAGRGGGALSAVLRRGARDVCQLQSSLPSRLLPHRFRQKRAHRPTAVGVAVDVA